MKRLSSIKGITLLSKAEQKQVAGGARFDCIPKDGINCYYLNGQTGEDGCCVNLVCKHVQLPNGVFLNICQAK